MEVVSTTGLERDRAALFAQVVGYVVLVVAGLFIGAIAGLMIGLSTGLIPFVC